MDFSTPSVKQVSDFFMYMYQDLNRRPSTIDGYRTAIVDTLGQMGTISIIAQTSTGCSPVFTGVVPKVSGIFQNGTFIALIHPIQWTIANPVGADWPAKCQKKTSCVATGRPVPVVYTPQMAPRTSFLSRQPDVLSSFSCGTCTV